MAPSVLNFVYHWANTKFASDVDKKKAMQYLLSKHLLLSLYPAKQMQNQKKFTNMTHHILCVREYLLASVTVLRERERPFPFSLILLPILQALFPFPSDPINP
jgi:hypothetical protein